MQSEHSELRDAFDQQVRRNVTPDGSGANAEYGANYVRRVADNDSGWSEVCWSSLDAVSADEAVAAQIEFYRRRNLSFVWRVYDYDQPADLGQRLVSAGLIESGTSAVMLAESSRLSREPVLPEGTELLHVSDEAGVNLLIDVHESVFGHSHAELRRSILRRLDLAPQEADMFIVMAGEVPVSSSRIEFLPATDFAALWGGSTEPEWRGKGIYRALVCRRAQLAHEKGYRYLMVMASDHSRPILSELGFEIISRVTTYSWTPNSACDEAQ
jgi:GNAT superfamily N-acetyltransferase